MNLKAGSRALLPRTLDAILAEVPVILVIIGRDGLGRWQEHEYATSLDRIPQRRVRAIPVLLPGSSDDAKAVVPPC